MLSAHSTHRISVSQSFSREELRLENCAAVLLCIDVDMCIIWLFRERAEEYVPASSFSFGSTTSSSSSSASSPSFPLASSPLTVFTLPVSLFSGVAAFSSYAITIRGQPSQSQLAWRPLNPQHPPPSIISLFGAFSMAHSHRPSEAAHSSTASAIQEEKQLTFTSPSPSPPVFAGVFSSELPPATASACCSDHGLAADSKSETESKKPMAFD